MWRSASAVVIVLGCCGLAAAADLPLPKDFRKPGPDTIAPQKPNPPTPNLPKPKPAKSEPAKPEPAKSEPAKPEPAKPEADRPAPANPQPADTPPPARRHIPLTPMHPGPVMPAPPPQPPAPEPQTAPKPAPTPQPLQSPAPGTPAEEKGQLNDLQAPPPLPSPRAGDSWWQAVVQKAPQCRSFSDGCRTCDPQFSCSSMPIACQPKEFVCADPKDTDAKASAPKAPAQ